jgi:hypothetical protein
MKYSAILSLGFLLALSVPSIGQTQNPAPTQSQARKTNPGLTPPHRVQANFNARYPKQSSTARWQQNEQGYKASFRENNRNVVSVFNEDGRWIESRTEFREKELPAHTRQYLKDNYDKYEYLGGYRYDDESGSRYELELRSGDKDYRLNFDAEGGFINEGLVERN